MIDGRTCRAARGFLNWTSRTLSAKSGVPVSRIFEIERDRPIGTPYRRALEAVFLRHGVAIAYEGGRPVGLREAPPLDHMIARLETSVGLREFAETEQARSASQGRPGSNAETDRNS